MGGVGGLFGALFVLGNKVGLLCCCDARVPPIHDDSEKLSRQPVPLLLRQHLTLFRRKYNPPTRKHMRLVEGVVLCFISATI